MPTGRVNNPLKDPRPNPAAYLFAPPAGGPKASDPACFSSCSGPGGA